MMSKFPGSDHSCRRRYVIKLFVGKKNNKNKNEIYICEAVCDAVREWLEVTRPSARLSNNDFSTFQAIRNFFEKSR